MSLVETKLALCTGPPLPRRVTCHGYVVVLRYVSCLLLSLMSIYAGVHRWKTKDEETFVKFHLVRGSAATNKDA